MTQSIERVKFFQKANEQGLNFVRQAAEHMDLLNMV